MLLSLEDVDEYDARLDPAAKRAAHAQKTAASAAKVQRIWRYYQALRHAKV